MPPFPAMPVRLGAHVLEGHTLRVWGATDVLTVSFPLEGVARVRALPDWRAETLTYPHVPPKHSFAGVPQDTGLTPDVHEDGPHLTARAGGLSVTVDRASGAWIITNDAGDPLAAALDWRANGGSDRARSTLTLHAPARAAYLGFGEKVGPLDKRGLSFTFWNTDCFPHHTESDPLYASIPFTTRLLDGRASGVFLDETWRMDVDVARTHPHELRWASAGPSLDVYVIDGPHPTDVLRRYAALTGHAPLPPLWALGAAQSRWGYESEHDLTHVIRGYRERDLPLDSVYVDIEYMDAFKVWTFDPGRFPDPARTVRDALAHGVHLVPIVDPGVKQEAGYRVYDEAVRDDHLVRTARGDVLVGEVWPDPAVYPDFTRDEVVAWWAEQHRVFADLGITGQWNDMNEPAAFSVRGDPAAEGKTLPNDARHGLRTHLEVHNAYANGMSAATRQGYARYAPHARPWVLTRAAYAGIQKHATLWTGDNTSTWSHLALSLPMIMGLGLSGVPFAAADVGGFHGDTTGELLTRWYQAAVGYAFLRNHSAKGSVMQEPWRFGEPYLSVIRDALRLRARLLPHLYTLAWQAAREALPVMRPVALHHPDDPHAAHDDTTYLLGDALLVAPILHAGHTRRLVNLPGARPWAAVFNLTPGTQVHPGGHAAVADAALDTLPLYLRAGGAVPLTEPAPHTTTARWAHLTWLIHAGDAVHGALYEDDGDGHGPHRLTELTGALDGATLTLTRTTHGDLAVDRPHDTLVLLGLPDGDVRVTGAAHWTRDAHAVHVTAPADWTTLTVQVQA
ncbi:TIM-barrel domain-containing protein [Deinococcus maricopensis]|uniref:Glycoside hydrolase family 31 n=1 Tax=Deinococcus maricopensis (strain DSM 21211 / LMG 22137 / NRRL B-23946 / LB-34) TaxID=709986 RepID=E8UC63_DEIML|nr:TIM-barrel domain-containing protein [Deinococcus maricopensis]ADV68724.1 glycoside hydrolase family 31 [Deinococcus maricopensis DSM 21211]